MPSDIPNNRFKVRLRSAGPLFGSWSTLGHPIATEILGEAGFDFLILDTEHGPADTYATLLQLQALKDGRTAACVRVAGNEPVLMKKALDIGAQTLIVPQVDSADDARRAIGYTLFPPAGMRGVSTIARASRYGAVPEYHRRAHEELCVVLMIESAAALAALPAIAEVPGVDAMLIGCQDLAADMGFLSRPDTPEVVSAIGKAIETILAHGKSPGVAAGSEEDAARWVKHGAKFVTCGSDVSLLARSAQGLAQRLANAVRLG
jgi:4-hydroxy-2-oxoheptanedioate aldolase